MAFLRVLISLFFIFLSIHVFADTAGGTNSYTYWKSYPNHFSAGQQCKESLTALCSSAFGGFKTTNQSCTTDTVECKEEYNGTIILNNTCRSMDQWGVETGTTYQVQEGYSNITYYNKQTHTCPAGQHLKLDGCNVSCEIDNPCMDKKDQEKELEELCGLSVCPAGAHFDTTYQVCKNAANAVVPAQSTYNVPSPGQISSFDGCEVVSLPSPDAIGRGYFKANELGGSELSTYCPVKYKFTGNKGSDASGTGSGGSGDSPNLPAATDSTSPPLADLPKLPPNMYYPPTGGSCNAGDAQGTYGAGDSAVPVCAKQSGQGDGGNDPSDGLKCLDGSPIPTSGTCPTTDGGGGDNPTPTTCPNNAPKNTDGTCPTSTTGGGAGGSCTSTTCSANTTTECRTAPTCRGDAINCAILLQSWKNACLLIASPTSEQQADITKSMTETDTALSGIKSTYQASLDSAMSGLPSNISTSSVCLADSSFTLLGKSIPIPLSKLCPYFQTMRSMLLLLSYLFAARIIFGSIGGGGGVRV